MENVGSLAFSMEDTPSKATSDMALVCTGSKSKGVGNFASKAIRMVEKGISHVMYSFLGKLIET